MFEAHYVCTIIIIIDRGGKRYLVFVRYRRRITRFNQFSFLFHDWRLDKKKEKNYEQIRYIKNNEFKNVDWLTFSGVEFSDSVKTEDSSESPSEDDEFSASVEVFQKVFFK